MYDSNVSIPSGLVEELDSPLFDFAEELLVAVIESKGKEFVLLYHTKPIYNLAHNKNTEVCFSLCFSSFLMLFPR